MGSRFRRTKVSERVREEGEQKGEREREKNSSWEASRRRWINRHVRGRGAASIRRWNVENARANKNMAQLRRAAKGRKREFACTAT